MVLSLVIRIKEGEISGKAFKVSICARWKVGLFWVDCFHINIVCEKQGANKLSNVDLLQYISRRLTLLQENIPYSLFRIESGLDLVIFNSEWDLEHGHFQ